VPKSTPVRSLRQSREQQEIAYARLCYDHLAGRLGVAVTDACLRLGWLAGEHLAPTTSGVDTLASIGIESRLSPPDAAA
jgi:hypothetical protein